MPQLGEATVKRAGTSAEAAGIDADEGLVNLRSLLLLDHNWTETRVSVSAFEQKSEPVKVRRR